MRYLVVALITLVLLVFVDFGFRILGEYKFIQAPDSLGGPLSAERTAEFQKKVDHVRLARLPDKFAHLRKLTDQTLDHSQLKTNAGMDISECPRNDRSIVRLKPSDELLFSVDYLYDLYCRRDTVPSNPDARQFILAVGDSFTFGQGVEDQETYPSQLAARWPGVKVYNLGICGAGPNRMLRSLQVNPTVLSDITQKEGVAVYHMIEQHMLRVSCMASCLNERSYIFRQPWYSMNSDGGVEYRGTFQDRWFTNLLLWPLAHSAARQVLGLDFPRISDREYDLFVAILKDYRREIEKQKPLKAFVVVLGHGMPIPLKDAIVPRLSQSGFQILDYSEVDTSPILGASYDIPFDHHPTARYYAIFADWLKADLSALLSQDVPKSNGQGSLGAVGRAFF